MKKKLLIFIFALICVSACASGCASCSSCNDGDETVVPPSHTHVYDREIAERQYLKASATCQNRAVYYYSCECGQKGNETFEYGDLGEHNFSTYISDNNATCTHDCTETAKCEYCDETVTREIADSKTGHSFIEYLSDDNATCMKNCTETARCVNCDATDTRDIPNSKLKHVFADYIPDNNATCERDGTATAVCENCHVATDSIIVSRRLPHTFVNYVSDENATCTENCTETARCEHCCATDTREIADSALGHTFEVYVSNLNGNCTENGTETATCKYCTATDEREEADSKIHSYVDGKCELCGKRRVTEGLEYELNEDGASYCLIGKGTATDTEICIPSTYNGLPVTAIGENALSYTIFIESLFIPYSVKSIDKSTFASNSFSWLERITVEENNENYKSVDGNLLSKDGTEFIKYPVAKNEKEFKFPDGVTVICDYAFDWCRLERITIPDGVNSIGKYAFAYNNLKSVTIPYSVTSIDKSAFVDCWSLEEITVDKNNENYKSVDGILYSKDGTNLIKYTTGKEDTYFEIPQGVTTIGAYAFSYSKNLTRITIPDGVTDIGMQAFSDCTNLENINIPNGITIIKSSTFRGCKSLTSINIPNGVKSISDYAFSSCKSLESIFIPESVTSLGYYSPFSYCSSLKSITVADGNEKYKSIDGNLYSKDGKTLVQYAIGKEDSVFVIPDGVTDIGRAAFDGCENMTLIIPESVTFIGQYAFNRNLDKVFYCGTEEQWNAIRIVAGNSPLTSADLYFYSEAQPEAEGSFWHYAENGEIATW